MRIIDAEPLIEFFKQKRAEWFDLDIGTSTAYDIAKQSVMEAPTVDAVTWKDFIDFLDDNADDFDRIDQRLDALTKQVSELTQAVGRIEGTHIEIEAQNK